jgi:hypothetical protein
MFFLNNCRRRDYVGIYEIADAFYDLELTGWQGDLATTFRPGDECIVATTEKNRQQVRFTRRRLTRIERRPDEKGTTERVFCGPVLESETLSKADAAREGRYSIFFNRKGYFKQQSVLEN